MNIFNQKGFCRPPNPVNPANSRDKWILCRSTTTLPGKHYWFNRLTGEASWSDVPDNGKPQPKDFQIPSQSYKYNYQEPSSPPYDTSPHPLNNNIFSFPPNPYQINNYPQPKQSINQSYNQSMNYRLTPPGFGQASFPKYFLDAPLTNDKAQPLFIQTSFNQPIISKDVSFSAMIRKSNDLIRRRDQFTQTSIDNSYSVHTTSQTLHKRFINTSNVDSNFFKRCYQNYSETDIPIKRTRVTYDNNTIKINENDNFNNITNNNYSQNYTHTFEKKPKSNRNSDVWTTTDLNNEIDRISSKEFDGHTLKIINTKLKVDKETNTELKVQKSMFSPDHEPETKDKEVSVLETREIEPFNLLAKDDLRFRLLERKSELEQSRNEDGVNKDSQRPSESAKKRVTFRDDYLITNVNDDQIVDGFELEDNCGYYEDREPSHEVFSENFDEATYIKLNIARLKNLSTIMVKDVWYIAVDLPSLITDYEFLIKLVHSDTSCTLLIPEQVKRTLDAQCKGSCLGRRDVMLVRHVSRDLARRRDKISIQQTFDKKKIDISKNILECCTEKTNRGYYVILITTDAELRRRCKSHDIPTFTIENIKEFVTETDENKPKAKPKTVAVTRNIPNSNSNGNIFLGDHPQSILERFKSQNSFTITTEIDKTQSKDFSYNSVKKTISNENTTLLPKHNGTVFKIPKISKFSEKRVNLESLVEEKLKKFTPSSEAVEQRFELAKESWLCSFGQIVEDGFTYILQVSEDLDLYDYPPPWTLLQAIKCVKLLTKEENVLTRVVVDKLQHIVYDFSVKDFINPNIRFDDFLTIFGLSYLLFEALKEKSEFSNISTETLSNLDEMLASLNDVISKPDAIFDNKMPTVSIDICTDLVPDEGNKVIKKDEEVLEYLRRHYSHFKNENIILQTDNNVDNKKNCNERNIKIIRTLGRDVNKITLTNSNNTKMIVMQESIEKFDENRNENDNDKNDRDDYDTGSIFVTNNESTAKIVRNISVIPEFEDRLEKKKRYDDRNDNYKSGNAKADFVDYKKENFTKTNEFIHENENENVVRNDNDTGENNEIDIDVMSLARLSIVMTSDSGIVKSNESLYVQSIVELFLSEITSSFYAVFNVINKGRSIITKGEISSKRQRKLTKKISIASEGIQNLANRIQSIIEREATGSENSFRILLVKSGVDPDNVKTYRYRQVLIKCLEQIRILSSALDILDAVARNDDASKTRVTDASGNIGTYNIFEQV